MGTVGQGVRKVSERTREVSTSKEVSGATWTGELTRVFDVDFYADSTQDPDYGVKMPLWAVDSGKIPQLNEEHPYDPNLYVTRIAYTGADGALSGRVVVTYTRTEDPIEQDPQKSWTFATSNEPIDQDRDGNPITNSSGEPFDPPITEDFDDLVYRVVRYEESWDARVAAERKGGTNSAIWDGWPKGTARLKIFDAVEERIGNQFFYQVTIEIHFRPDGWRRRLLDQGYREKDAAGVFTAMKDADGNILSQPVKLDGNGGKLAEGATPVYKIFHTAKEFDFSLLDL